MFYKHLSWRQNKDYKISLKRFENKYFLVDWLTL